MNTSPWKLVPRSSLFALPCLLLLAACQDEKSDVSKPALPAGAKIEPGKVSMVADFTTRLKDGRIPVVILNGTEKPLMLTDQDPDIYPGRDIYLKLEVQDGNGKWTRAQPHRFSGCGNSYGAISIRAGGIKSFAGYQPEKGESRTVRFRLYHQDIELVSNTGTALAAASDIELAASDAMSITDGDFDYVFKVALGTLKPVSTPEHFIDPQERAIHTLGSGKFGYEKCREALLKVESQVLVKGTAVTYAWYSLDQSTITGGDLDYVSKVALGTLKPVSEEKRAASLQNFAIEYLGHGKLDVAQCREVLLKVKSQLPEKAPAAGSALQRLSEREKTEKEE